MPVKSEQKRSEAIKKGATKTQKENKTNKTNHIKRRELTIFEKE